MKIQETFEFNYKKRFLHQCFSNTSKTLNSLIQKLIFKIKINVISMKYLKINKAF